MRTRRIVQQACKIFAVTRDHLFSAENPDDVARALELTAYLEDNQALVPIPWDQPF